MEKAMQLQLHLRSTSCSEAQDLLLQRILSTFDKALMTLRRSQSIGQAQVGTPISVAPESSVSIPAEAITVVHIALLKTAQQQSKCKGRMMTPLYLKSRTKEFTPVISRLMRSHHQRHRKNKNLRVETTDLDIKEMPAHFSFPSPFPCHDTENQFSPISALADDNQLCTYSPLFYSPATSESNYFSAATYEMKNYGGTPMGHSETDIGDIISAHASTTNSPIGGMEFPFDPVDLDPDFPFNTAGFFI